MDYNLDKTALLFFVIALTATSCTVPEEIAETANQRFNQSMDWNNKHSYREIVVQTDDYSIMSTGDCHVGGTINLDSFFKIAEATSASAIVIAGDLTTGHEKDYDVFEQYMSVQDSLPAFLVAGNHDLFAKHKVDMVITGHDHKHDAVQFGRTTYIIMDAIKDGYSDAGYLEIRVKNDNIMFNFKTL